MNWYDSDAQVLTQQGFKPIVEVKQSDAVAILIGDTIEFSGVVGVANEFGVKACVKICRRTAEQQLFGIFPRQNAITMTESTILGTRNYAVPFEQLRRKNVSNFKMTGSLPIIDSIAKLSPVDRFRIATQADGHLRPRVKRPRFTVVLKFKRVRKSDRLEDILSELDPSIYTWELKVENLDTFTVYSDMVMPKRFADWINLSQTDYNWCKNFIEEVAEWDGSRREPGVISYSNKNAEDVSIVQAVAVLCGYYTRLNYIPNSELTTLNMNCNPNHTNMGMIIENVMPRKIEWYSLVSKKSNTGVVMRNNGYVYFG